ncbi:MAG: winged helix-turn-helix transcriptional regulator [Candidatus Micrarchaeota archaeon]|nr:winged helix-turn-helix transcriptional regulator [Candidatus Micrarchaeota archaeon]
MELKLKINTLCDNINRLAILYLLRKAENTEMKAEDISSILGVSHRTALYHLTILKDYDLVEVRKFNRRGFRLFRSVWGLKNDKSIQRIFDIILSKYTEDELREIIKKNIASKKSSSRKKTAAYII